jgi:hypothetical protein
MRRRYAILGLALGVALVLLFFVPITSDAGEFVPPPPSATCSPLGCVAPWYPLTASLTYEWFGVGAVWIAGGYQFRYLNTKPFS